jgi:aldehyde dehydrogenase (NAD+)
VPNKARVAQEEIFGPVLVIVGFDDDQDAVRTANDSPYGLSGAVFSADQDRAVAVAKRIRTGTISVNGSQWFDPDSPFGGYKQSGLGREWGPEGFEDFLETKTMSIPG